MCQEIIPRINGSHKKKPNPAQLMQYMLWIEKLLNYLYATSISWQLTDQSFSVQYLSLSDLCISYSDAQGGRKKKSKMEWVTFDSTASSIQIKASVSKAGRQTAISLQQHLPNKTLTFPLNSDTKRMYKMSNQRIIKECHYNYQSLKASR